MTEEEIKEAKKQLLAFCTSKENNPKLILERELKRQWKGSDVSTTKLFYRNAVESDFITTEKDCCQETAYNYETIKEDIKKSYNAYICYILSTFRERGIDDVMANIDLNKVKSYTTPAMMECILWTGSAHSCDTLTHYESFYAAMTDEDMLNDIFDHHSETNVTGAKLLLALACICFNENKFGDIYSIWSTNDLWSHYNLDDYMCCCNINGLDGLLPKGGSIFNDLKGGIRNKWDEKRTEHKKSGNVYAGGSVIKTSGETLYYYGEAVQNWIKNLPYRGNFGITKLPSPSQNGHAFKIESGCVVEGTMIKMYEQRDKAIEDIVAEDLVLNKTMCASICSEERIINDNVKKLYGINNDAPFMSLEHAVFTIEKGWCSLDPDCSNQINHRWKVKKLSIGDHVLKINKKNEISYEMVKNINIIENNRRCYDLHFYEGSNSYFANGYACLLNYPVLTLTNVLNLLHRNHQLNNLKKNWEKIAPFLKTIFSEDNFRYIEEKLERTDIRE